MAWLGQDLQLLVHPVGPLTLCKHRCVMVAGGQENGQDHDGGECQVKLVPVGEDAANNMNSMYADKWVKSEYWAGMMLITAIPSMAVM